MDAATLLANTLSPDNAVRQAATEQLETAARDSFPQYMHTLASTMGDESAPSHVRNAAGLAFKNALNNRSWTVEQANYERWRALDPALRQNIKQTCLQTLGSPVSRAGTVAAQAVAAIAAAELPHDEWMDLIQTLLEFVQGENANLRVATLQCIGFICEVIAPTILESRSNEILTAVVQGARKEEMNADVQVAAIQALYNSLDFIRDNFDREGERNYIMQVVCEATQSSSINVQVGAYECLVRIMQLYYDKMALYMERALFGLTVLGMQNEEEKVALQAIEFWATVCDEEAELAIDAADAAEYGDTPDIESRHFARTALPEILPVLLNNMLKQDEDADEDEWNVSMAAGTCVALLASVSGDAIVQPVIPFIEQNITSQDWHRREASVMVFGSILDGPDSDKLAPLVQQALPTLINMMQDSHPSVKDTTAWTLGRITELIYEAIESDIHLPQLIAALETGLRDSNNRVAANAAWAIQNIAASFGSADDEEEQQSSSALSPHFARMMTTLMQAGQAKDSQGQSAGVARTAIYTAIGDLISNSSTDMKDVVAAAGSEICTRVEALLSAQNQIVGADDRNNWNDMQSNYCQVLQATVRKLGPDIARLDGFSDRVMGILLRLLDSGKDVGVAEDAFVSINAVIEALESNFSPAYVQALMPFVLKALGTLDEFQVFTVAVGTVGDLARSLGRGFTPLAQPILNLLLTALSSPVLHRTAKPPVVSAIGDVAAALETDFAPYLDGVMGMMMQAGQVKVDEKADVGMEDFVLAMRESVLEAFSGIINGFAAGGNPEVTPLVPYVASIINFATLTIDDPKGDDAGLRGSYNVLGDVARAFGGQAKDLLLVSSVQRVIGAKLKKGHSRSTLTAQKYARKTVKEATA